MSKLDDLFRTKIRVSLKDKVLWMRVLSDLELQAREEYGTLLMAKRRKALATPDTPEYERYVAALDSETDEALHGSILLAEKMNLIRESQNEPLHPELAPQLYPFPDGADDAEQTECLAQREAEPKRIGDLRQAFVEKRLAEKKSGLEQFDHTQLLAQTRERQKDAQGRAAFFQGFMDYTLYASVFLDETCRERVFDSPEDARSEVPEVRDYLGKKYFEDLDRVNQQDLKYFLSTTPFRDSTKPSLDSTTPISETPETLPGGSPLA